MFSVKIRKHLPCVSRINQLDGSKSSPNTGCWLSMLGGFVVVF